ncbi:hypothetical protein BDN70DRAFT_976119 [Pholiota conissans]|uniref:Uncharacterized protein n=1 Tax=Pholiota conissans TaxID=109636 RepID=A0A9P5Z436_9AGAR|nr:hypothetical protein BDN70DRAFT_976119 [Pholiota conissans]
MDWTSNDLASYNIEVHRQSAEEFFGYTPDTLPSTIEPGFLIHTFSQHTQPFSVLSPLENETIDSNYPLLPYLDLASQPGDDQEPAIGDFMLCLMRTLEFQEQGNIVRIRAPLSFALHGENEDSVLIDLCLIQLNTTILIIVEESLPVVDIDNPEARVIAKAIAAFQYNNRIRQNKGFDPLDSMTFPAIVTIGTVPVFYKIPVTRQLENAVANDTYPTNKTEVLKCMVELPSHSLEEGMDVPEFRREILRNYEAFRRLSKKYWQCFAI